MFSPAVSNAAPRDGRPDRSTDKRAASLRSRSATDLGIFLVYDTVTTLAPKADDTSQASTLGGLANGYLAYWADVSTQSLFVYGRVLRTSVDVGQAVENLAIDLTIESGAITANNARLSRSVLLSRTEPLDATMWHLASRARIAALMRVVERPINSADAGAVAMVALPPSDGIPCDCEIAAASGPRDTFNRTTDAAPTDRAGLSPLGDSDVTSVAAPPVLFTLDELIATLASVVKCDCNGDGGGTPPVDPCEGSTDPCCGVVCDDGDPCTDSYCDNGLCASNPNNDRCCVPGNPCCESPDPCCDETDPCCGNPDPCCNPDNPCCSDSSGCCHDRCCQGSECCGSEDPCCDPNDPCCGNPDPCCNPDNPDCGLCAEACCNDDDPCCNDLCCGDAACCLDRCCQGSDCCGSDDPCCDLTDPCCGNLDPCCNPDNPDCNGAGRGGGGVVCENSPDPCCGDPCDDENPCTDDICEDGTGICTNTCPQPGFVSAIPAAQGCPVTVKLEEISFGGAGRVFVAQEAPPCATRACWGTTGGFVLGPAWKANSQSVANPNLPVAYVRGTTMTLVVGIASHGSPEGTATLRVTGPDGLTGEALFLVNGCTPINRTVTITTNALPNSVRVYNRMGLKWSVKEPDSTTFRNLRNTSHVVFVTLGQPTGGPFGTSFRPTRRRLFFVCGVAGGSNTALQAIDRIHSALNGPQDRPPLDGCKNTPDNLCVDDWRLMTGGLYRGECDEQARFMVTAVQLLGGPTLVAYKTWPSTGNDCDPTQLTVKNAADAGITWDIDGDGTIGEELLYLRFDFPDDTPAGDGSYINAFEGTVGYFSQGKYYAVWPSLKATSKCGMLAAIKNMGAKQCWDPVDTPDSDCVRNPDTGILKLAPFPVCAPGCP